MVFALLGGLFGSTNTVKAQKPSNAQITATKSNGYARKVTVHKEIYYNNKLAGTASCNVGFTYDVPTGKPRVSNLGTSTVGSNGYTLTVTVTDIDSGNRNPASITYSYSVKKGQKTVSTGKFKVNFYNNGNYS